MQNFLQEFGYDTVQLPKEGINPFAILRKGAAGADRIGNLAGSITENEQEKFPPIADAATANINGKKIMQTDFHSGIELLKSLLANLGSHAPAGLDIVFKKARSISFAATNTICTRVDLLSLQSFVNHPGNKEIVDDIILNNGTVYIITEILKTNTFSVEAHDESNQKIALNIPEIKGIIQGDIGINHSSDKENNIAITGANRLTYGYKAVKIERHRASTLKFWQKTDLKFSLTPVTGLLLNE
jgi:hypothetical protein